MSLQVVSSVRRDNVQFFTNKGLEHAASSDGAGVVVVVNVDCGQSSAVVRN